MKPWLGQAKPDCKNSKVRLKELRDVEVGKDNNRLMVNNKVVFHISLKTLIDVNTAEPLGMNKPTNKTNEAGRRMTPI